MSRRTPFAGFAAGFAAAWLAAASARAQEPPAPAPADVAPAVGDTAAVRGAPQVIAEVRVLGNERAEESLVLEAFGFQPGQRYQVDRLRAGVKNVWRQGLFRDVRIEASPGPAGLVLTIRVEENPTLLRVRYDGADKLDEDDFREVVQLAAGQTVGPRAVDQARRDILTLYRDKGYLLAEVEPELKGDRKADLVFRITEGKKVQVAKIEFRGNREVSSEDLRDAMKTKEDRWWRGGDLKRDVLEEDRKRILDRLGQEGFADARIVEIEETYGEDKSRLALGIEVEEGPRYRVGAIALDHGGILPENRIRSAVHLREGEHFDTVAFDQSVTDLYSLFQEEGYIYANVDARRTPREGNAVDVDFQILERDPARIRRILITGNSRTREDVIRREMRVAPGDVFKRSSVIRSQREIFQLGFFDDIQLDSRAADRETGEIDLVVNVEERQTGTASLGAGVNSEAGLTGFLQLSQNNFLGRGQVMSLRGEFGRFREYDVSFTEPWLFGTPTSAGVDLFDTRRRYTEYTEKRRGGEIRFGRPFPWLDYTRVSARYSLAEYRVDAESGYEDEIGEIEPSTISAVTLSLARNSVDSPFFPTRGWSSRITEEVGGGILGGDETYLFTTLENRAYFRTVGKLVLSLSGQVGLLNGLDDVDDVPFWKRFRLGGISRYALRGYDDYDVVPDQSQPSTGGRAMLISTTELRYPVVSAVQALAFFDVGNTWRRPDEIDLSGLRRGAGLGVRIDVPMVGQLGFDYGYGFDATEEEGGPGWQFHFQIGGQSF
jgi:outer membrane protein insertion porin family